MRSSQHAVCAFDCRLSFVPMFVRLKFSVSEMPRIENEVKINVLDTWLSNKGLTLFMDEVPGRGRKPGCSNTKLDQKLGSPNRKNKSMSIRYFANNAETSVGMIQRIKKWNNLKTYKRQTKCRIKSTCCNKGPGVSQRMDASFLMHDETYVKEDSKTLPGPQ